ncbi:membrane-bound lytic murein transglycosylase F [Bisgaardia hudsonensis]|uniref:Membrane-bound lytic murein transglycosylase F n=2 Tax=Bisgaardia hudsonensis TaxID=109472 RepID=A0A4R2N281_9PAST|nr:membrane-bound lytic murein transglycosylase F [Bisgaardia hudsonensis]
MVFPWQKVIRDEESRYTAIQKRGELILGTINNPISYFIDQNGQSGLEYELGKHFADYLGVKLDIKVFENSTELFRALEQQQIDIAAANLLYDSNKATNFQLGPSYYNASWQLVYKKGQKRPLSFGDIDGKISISSGTGINEILNSFTEKYARLSWEELDKTQEEILLKVAEGKIDYAIATSIDVAAVQQIRPEISVAFDLTDESTVHWYLANNAYNELQAALLGFTSIALETGVIARIEEKYFSHLSQFDYVDIRAYMRAIQDTLPTYIELFKKYQGNLDWKLLAAIAYQESHWEPKATSPTGVRGMMMLTKATADRMQITDRLNPEQSIKAGSEYIHLLLNQMPNSILKEDRIWFALVAYNMGLGHLLDVRRLTKQLGGNPDNWLDVKNNLPLLAEKRYYSKLKYGYARGYEALQYVENIRRYMNSIINYHRVEENIKDSVVK